jgi:peptide-methionine (R)-S-oxide reductase
MSVFDKLTPEERRVIVGKGTEAPFSGEYNDHYEHGVYQCRACSTDLYTSVAKFKSGCGWPSFDDEISGALVRHTDMSGGMTRIEICCANCDGHLGHVFEGEALTEKSVRHCVNSVSLRFVESKST